MKKNNFLFILIAFLASITLFSCNNESPNPEPEIDPISPNEETWIIFNGNADWSGGIYTMKSNKSSEIKLTNIPFLQLEYSAGGKVFGKNVYKLNGNKTTDIGIAKYSLTTAGPIAENGFVATQQNTYEVNYLVVSDTEGYYWDPSAGGLKVQKFDPSTMKRTGEIDFTSLSKGNSYEAAGQLILAKRDNKLYVDVQHGTKTRDWQIVPAENTVYIAVYDLTSDKIEKVTEYKGASHLGLFSDDVLWSIDQITKDLYVVAIGNMRSQTPESKILRIKNGETEFDKNFVLNIKDYQYPSDFNRILAHNNKIYTTISSRPTTYYGGGQHGVTYRQDIWYWTEIDVVTKKATRLNIPPDNFYSYQNPFYYAGNIYFLSNNKENNYAGVNQYNPQTGEIKETFRLVESGRVMGFNIIKP